MKTKPKCVFANPHEQCWGKISQVDFWISTLDHRVAGPVMACEGHQNPFSEEPYTPKKEREAMPL